MKKNFTTILVLIALPLTMIAQPTFTSSNFNPLLGESVGGTNFDTTSFTTPTLGTNMTWDYSGLVFESSNPPGVVYVAPSTTTYAASFTMANAAVGSNDAYNYYLYNSIGQYQCGEGSPSQIVSQYDLGTLYTFPFTYGFTLSDSMHANFMAGSFPAERHGLITTVADGYGTLILPNGTYNNVLHVTQRWQFDETVDYGSTTMTGTFIYKFSYWFRPNTHFPLLNYSQFGINNGFTEIWTETGSYIDAAFVDVKENENGLQCSYYPNPSNGEVNLIWNDSGNENLVVNVYNTIGQAVYTTTLNNIAGRTNYLLDLKSLESGTYLIRVIGNNSEYNGKLIIE